MTTQENLVDSSKTSGLHDFWQEVGDPIQSWNFDIFVDDKQLWLATKIKVDSGRLSLKQVLNSSGMYDLSGKRVRVVFYTEAPAVATELSFKLGKIDDVNLSCDATGAYGCAEVEAFYNCKFVSVTNHCDKVSA